MLRIESSKWVAEEELEIVLGLDFNYYDKKGIEEIRALEPNMQAIQIVDRGWVRRDGGKRYTFFKVKTKSGVKKSYATRQSSYLALVNVAMSDGFGYNTSTSQLKKWLKTNRRDVYDDIPYFHKADKCCSDKTGWKVLASNKALYKREGLGVCVELPLPFFFRFRISDDSIRDIMSAMVKNHSPLNIYITDVEKKEVLVRWGLRIVDRYSSGYEVMDINGKRVRINNLIGLLRKVLHQVFDSNGYNKGAVWKNILLHVGNIKIEDFTSGKRKLPLSTKIFEVKSQVIIDGFGTRTLVYGHKLNGWFVKLEGFNIPIKYPSYKRLVGAFSVVNPTTTKHRIGRGDKIWKPAEFLSLLADVTKMENEKLVKLFKNLIVMKS